MGTPFTRVNGKGNDNVDINKLITQEENLKISIKSTKKINILLHQLEDLRRLISIYQLKNFATSYIFYNPKPIILQYQY